MLRVIAINKIVLTHTDRVKGVILFNSIKNRAIKIKSKESVEIFKIIINVNLEINADINTVVDKIKIQTIQHLIQEFAEIFKKIKPANLEINVDINIMMDKIKILLHLLIPYSSNSTNF